MSPNRIVALLTPLVFAPLAGAIAAWVADNAPGVDVSASALEEIFIAGALIALAPAAQWLHGWQKYESREAAAVAAAEMIDAAPATIDEELDDFELEEELEFDEDELEDLDDLDDLDDPLVDEEPVPAGG
jgi:hypothetical protein